MMNSNPLTFVAYPLRRARRVTDQRARLNALHASMELRARQIEREEVQRFVDEQAAGLPLQRKPVTDLPRIHRSVGVVGVPWTRRFRSCVEDCSCDGRILNQTRGHLTGASIS